MRAIIIEDKDARALVDSLELTALKDKRFGISTTYLGTSLRDRLTSEEVEQVIEAIHRTFRYVVVGWLHDQGANTIK